MVASEGSKSANDASRAALLPTRRGIRIGLHLLGVAGIVFAYSSLLTLGTRYGFAKGVEYWLFRPSDNTPVVIVLLSGWLVYRRWPRLRALPRHTGPWWLIGSTLLVAQCFYLWAVYTSAADLQIFALVLNAIGLVAAYWGLAGLRVLCVPIAFLLFAIPMPAPFLLAIVYEMQIWTADLSGWILYVLGLPVLVSGDQILRATQAFQVIEGCSGLRSVETLAMLTVLLVDLFRRNGWHAWILFVLAPFVAFGLNGVRVLTLILNPHSEIIAIHNLQGIAILLVGLLIIYAVDGLLERLPLLRPRRAAARRPDARFVPRAALGVLLAIAGASTAALLFMPIWEEPGQARSDLAERVSEALSEWRSEKNVPDLIFRGSVRYGQIVDRRFSVEGSPVDVFAATADFGQRGGSPRSPLTAVPGSGWLVRESKPVRLELDGRIVEARVVEKGKRRLLVHHFYDGDRGLAVETARNLFAIDRSPLRRPRPLAVVRLATPIEERGDAARIAAEKRLELVYSRLAPALRHFLAGESV